MKNIVIKSIFAGALASVLLLSANVAQAQTDVTAQVNQALNQKNLTKVHGMLSGNTGSIDPVVKALLKHTQKVISQDPAYSNKMMQLAGQYAPKITAPSVPAICADLRRIVDAVPEGQAMSPLSATVAQVSEQFSRSPVVVSAGRPNQCETAFLRIATLRGQDPLLIQLPGMSGPGLPPTTILPGTPPTNPSPEEKPSAD